MLLKRNLLETLTIISWSATLICGLLSYVTSISPITGIWLTLYIILLFLVSVSLSFKFLQWLLQLSKPVKYDLDGLVQEYPYLAGLKSILPQPRQRIEQECKEYDTNELSVITSVLERKLVSSWYVPYISQEIGFPFACKQMLDQMIGKTFQIFNKIEPKDVYVDMCSILISHLKEYRKALKRQEKSPNSSIEFLYKKSHPISLPDNKLQSADHCTNVIRVVLKELVPWELWDTPHSELLVRILSKKLDSFMENTLSDPAWLNETLLTLLKGQEVTKVEPKEVPNTEEVKQDISDVKEDTSESKAEKPTVESALSTLITKTTAPILQRAINEEFQDELSLSSGPSEQLDIIEEVPVTSSEPVDIKSSPVLRQRRGRQGRNEVKIYDRIIEGSVKTWETDLDLQCISLGQDLLESLDGEITLSRLWGQDAEPDGSPNPPRAKSPQPLWFGEEDAIEGLEGSPPQTSSSPPLESHAAGSPPRSAGSPRKAGAPGDALLKDLQSTVHQAKSRIGDLQVPTVPLSVPRNCAGDEAAGMMEGLLDFGIAGLKKGLRFTGLSDDSQDKSPSHRAGERISPPEMGRPREGRQEPRETKKEPAEAKEAVSSNVVQKEENGSSSAPVLIKQQRVLSQDSVPSGAKPVGREFPLPLGALADSPEPEYEEAADLSTSIAKLRCLLQQRAEASPRVEEIWWEGAEETRGRTHTHPSTRPIDTATLADEYNMNIDRNASPGQTSNNMQRLDRLFQRTVTGVFNSIKTAVGAEAEGAEAARARGDWAYVCAAGDLGVCGSVARLVGSRRLFAHVDAALDSLHLAPPPPRAPPAPEDFEEWCALHGSGWCGGSELAAAAGLYSSHVTHRIATLLFADLAEALIGVWLDSASGWLRREVFSAFERMSDARDDSFSRDQAAPSALDVDETCAKLMEKVPPVLYVFGAEALWSAVRLSVASLSARGVNRDVCARALDALAAHFKRAAANRNPSFDNN